MTYLLTHPNPHGDHYYTSRREPILAVVEHITAGLEDLDALADQSAEATARYAATTERKVSWHQGTDSDSTIVLLPDGYTAFHVAGYNSCTLGRELSKNHTDWRIVPVRWREATLAHAARADADWCRLHRIPPRKATRGELDRARDRWRTSRDVTPVGFIGHGELDPERRTDPGLVKGLDTFPWRSYLELVRFFLHPVDPTEEDRVSKLLAMTRIEYLYRSVGRDPYNLAEAAGLLHWNEQLSARDEAVVVEECGALLYLAAGKAP